MAVLFGCILSPYYDLTPYHLCLIFLSGSPLIFSKSSVICYVLYPHPIYTLRVAVL